MDYRIHRSPDLLRRHLWFCLSSGQDLKWHTVLNKRYSFIHNSGYCIPCNKRHNTYKTHQPSCPWKTFFHLHTGPHLLYQNVSFLNPKGAHTASLMSSFSQSFSHLSVVFPHFFKQIYAFIKHSLFFLSWDDEFW